jgi:hypothetical protein
MHLFAAPNCFHSLPRHLALFKLLPFSLFWLYLPFHCPVGSGLVKIVDPGAPIVLLELGLPLVVLLET